MFFAPCIPAQPMSEAYILSKNIQRDTIIPPFYIAEMKNIYLLCAIFPKKGNNNQFKYINMKHFYLLCITLLLSVHSLFAQKNYAMWSYSDNTIESKWENAPQGETGAAIYIPAEVAQQYKGNLIKGLSVGFNSAVRNVTYFITKELGGKTIISRKSDNQNPGWNTVNLAATYTIDGEGFYVGYTASDAKAVGFSSQYNPNGCFLMADGQWNNEAEANQQKALSIKIKFEGKELPLEMRMLSLEPVAVNTGDKIYLKGRVESFTNRTIENYELGYRINNQEQTPVTVEAALQVNETHDFNIEIPAYDNGDYPMEVYIKSVNGQSDAYQGNNLLASTYSCSELKFVQRVVVEEGTASWCGNCPRGIEGFRAMNYKYPDTFIGIAVHKDDKMSVDEYSPFFEEFVKKGIPSSITNRNPELICNPIFINLEGYYKKEVKKRAIADVKIDAAVNANNDTRIKAEATIHFAQDFSEADYRVAFVLLENEVPGIQQNLGKIDFMDVSRAIHEYHGIKGSIPSKITKNAAYTYTYYMDVPTPGDINTQHPKIAIENCEMVALLIDGTTGMISNAAKVKVRVDDTNTGIDSENEPAAVLYLDNGSIRSSQADDQLTVYTIGGAMVSNENLAEGIYLVKVTRGAESFVDKFYVGR